ncbi:MAG: hypothetical protein L6R28_05950 [Planctomycetes bacterium]|nr:hypothetical protein [Planctomycetota bacterium]
MTEHHLEPARRRLKARTWLVLFLICVALLQNNLTEHTQVTQQMTPASWVQNISEASGYGFPAIFYRTDRTASPAAFMLKLAFDLCFAALALFLCGALSEMFKNDLRRRFGLPAVFVMFLAASILLGFNLLLTRQAGDPVMPFESGGTSMGFPLPYWVSSYHGEGAIAGASHFFPMRFFWNMVMVAVFTYWVGSFAEYLAGRRARLDSPEEACAPGKEERHPGG